MQSGAPTFGTPEPAHVLYGAGQLARRLGLPYRSGGSLCGSKLPDAQAAHESSNTIMPTLMGGVNFSLHAAGWLEGGLVSSYEKFILDCDQLGIMQKFAEGVDFSENGLAFDTISEIGNLPPQESRHYLGTKHTQDNFETAFYRSPVADNNSFEQWSSEGEKDAATRANGIFRKQLAEYTAPDLDPAIEESLRQFHGPAPRELAPNLTWP